MTATNAEQKSKNLELHGHARREGEHRKLKELLDNGADITSRDETGRDALILSTVSADLRNTLVLLRGGADIQTCDEHGDTPLHWAAYHRNEAVMKLLIKKGAKLGALNIKSETPLQGLRRMARDCTTRSVAPDDMEKFAPGIAFLEAAESGKLTNPFHRGTKKRIAVKSPLVIRPR
ncbi:MAG: hypothetical protein GC185_10125 [Alphaproteobacteria bacterium]|nr:hypothetical protein [Alphaproteobacteria bacterium]